MLYYYPYQWELGGCDPAPMHTDFGKPLFGAADLVAAGTVIRVS